MAHSPLDHVVDHAWVGPVTKYQVLLVVAAVAVAVPFILLARKVEDGTPPRGPLWNFFESLLLYIRDEVVRPNISHGADKYLPFLWTLFLFILTCNLLGMIPFLGSPTADISVTLVLAAIVFLVIHVQAIRENGVGGYVKSFIPHLEADNLPMKIFLTVLIVPLITVIEVMGAVIRGAVLAVRLFANIFAGHVALAVILSFALAEAAGGMSAGGTVAAVVMGTALSVLELFVAFLQAFVFVLLTSIFLGMQLHPEH
ncbi:MAG: F0F1 ATP synthase subunit A [Gemmataceae bacterium]